VTITHASIENGTVTTDPGDVNKITRGHYKQFYAKTVENLFEIKYF
jgi:hypothetical protein